MKNILITAALVLFGVFGVGYIVDAVITREAVRDIENRANNPTSQPIINEAEAKAEFVHGCVTEAMGVDNINTYCECMYNSLRRTYSVNQLINLSLNSSDAEIQRVMSNYVDGCITQTWGAEVL